MPPEHPEPEEVAGLDADVLLVEDNEGDVRLLREAFEEFDRSVAVVRDGQRALRVIPRLADRVEGGGRREGPSLVLLDLDLPGASGLDVLRALGDRESLRHLPVVVLSNSRADEDVADAYDARANAYLTKPADFDRLLEVVEAVDRFWLRSVRLP